MNAIASHTRGANAAAGSACPAVSATGLGRRYGRRWAVTDVDLRLEAGRSMMLTGRNGSGKSTLLRIISTAIRPDCGRVLVDGHDVRRERAQVRRRIALLGHHSNTYDGLTALQNLTVAARMTGAPADRHTLVALLDRVGLAVRCDDDVRSFSAGMRKRLAFARLLLQTDRIGPDDRSTKATIVLLDEPYGQLDPAGFLFVDDLIRSFRSRGITLLMATHLLGRGARLCDDGMVLDGGRLEWAGPAAGLANHTDVQSVAFPEDGD